MKKKLKKITNLTINDLLNNDIILPSSYFEKFTYHAKEMEVNLEDEKFNKELDQIILDDFNTIEEYMKIILSSAVSIQENAKEAKEAIQNKDTESLNNVYEKMIDLENEVKSLTGKLFIDDITNSFNKKWIYNKLLNKDSTFKEDGICVLLDISDYCYLQKEYGELLANNLLNFAIDFILQKLKDEKYNFKIARYTESKFFIFIYDENKREITNKILNIEQTLLNTTLKSNAGILIKAKYNFKISTFKENQDSKIIFETLLAQDKEE